MDYTAVGQTTHLAARMEQLAAADTIRLTAGTSRLVEGLVQVTPLGPVPVKGLGEPVEIFELTGAGTARTRLEAAARRGLTRFVGRGVELEQLRGALERARAGRGQVVAVVGEPGVGKSRFLWELTHSPHVHDCLILEAGSVSYGKATPYLPVIELLRAYFAIEPRDELRQIREKVTGRILALGPALAPAVPALLALLDVPVDEPEWQALDPRQRRQQTLDAVKRVFLRESERQPVAVVFEDLHWIDGETQALLDALVESLPAMRLVLLVNYRPEYQHAWGSKTYYRQLRIDPLPSESADELLGALLGPDPALGPLKQLLVERTEANPFFLEESVRVLVETAALTGERGAHRLTRPIEQLKIPATVQAILAARIDRLAPEAKRLLQAAAVIGKHVPLPLLLAIADVPEHEARAELTRLQVGEFLYEARLFPDLEYTFKHALTHEVAYGGLSGERRRRLHAAIVDGIERRYGDRLEEHVERLAHHALRGELWEKAIGFARRAGAKSMSRSAYREAIGHFDVAITTLARQPESRENLEAAVDLRFDLRRALFATAEHGRVAQVLSEAESAAARCGDLGRLGQVLSQKANLLVHTARFDEAVEAAEAARSLAVQTGSRPLDVGATLSLGMARSLLGDYREATKLLTSGFELQSEDLFRRGAGGLSLLAVGCLSELSLAASECGAFEEGIRHVARIFEIADGSRTPVDWIIGALAAGYLDARRGNFEPRPSQLNRARAMCQEFGLENYLMMVEAVLGYLTAWTGNVEEGLVLVSSAVARTEATGQRMRQSQYVRYQAEVALLAGRCADARVYAQRALDLARARRQRGVEAWALWARGQVAAAEASDEAEALYGDAIVLANTLGMRPLVAHCHASFARLHRRAGKAQQAGEHLAAAGEMYRDMGMRYWLARLDADA
jgi:tetratricopeptide (TPR) repeat protein